MTQKRQLVGVPLFIYTLNKPLQCCLSIYIYPIQTLHNVNELKYRFSISTQMNESIYIRHVTVMQIHQSLQITASQFMYTPTTVYPF